MKIVSSNDLSVGFFAIILGIAVLIPLWRIHREFRSSDTFLGMWQANAHRYLLFITFLIMIIVGIELIIRALGFRQ